MKVKISMSSTNAEDRLNAALDTIQKRSKVRTITGAEIIKSFDKIEDRLGIPKKHMDGCKIHVDLNSQDFPGAYKGRPESTQFTAINVNGRWTVVEIFRGDCNRLYQRVRVELSDTAKDAIIQAHQQLFI